MHVGPRAGDCQVFSAPPVGQLGVLVCIQEERAAEGG